MLAGLAGVGRGETRAFFWGDAESGVQRIETVMGALGESHTRVRTFQEPAGRAWCGPQTQPCLDTMPIDT